MIWLAEDNNLVDLIIDIEYVEVKKADIIKSPLIPFGFSFKIVWLYLKGSIDSWAVKPTTKKIKVKLRKINFMNNNYWFRVSICGFFAIIITELPDGIIPPLTAFGDGVCW